MSGYKVEICGVDTSTLPRLTASETNNLLMEVKAGKKGAREKFIKHNLRLVLSVVQRFSQTNENLDDIFQIGCVGLIKSIDNFDMSQGVQFSTYAVPMIIGEIKRYLRDNNSIRVSRSLKDAAYKIIHAKEELIKAHQKEPSITEISEETGIAMEDIVLALEAVQAPVSLYEPVFSEGGDTLYIMDQVSDQKDCEENWIKDIYLEEAINRLSKKEQNIIQLRFYKNKTQMETAAIMKISQAQVSRMEKCALKNMRKFLS